MSISSTSSLAQSLAATLIPVRAARSPAVSEPGSNKPSETRRPIVEDELTLSGSERAGAQDSIAAAEAAPLDARGSKPEEAKSASGTELSEEEQEQVDELQQRDREVRTHEQAHKSAAGPYARGGPTYQYQRGPDGQSYAVGGEVQIDTSPVAGDPEATIRKAQVVRAAALAPAEPSTQDRKVAAQATRMQAEAQSQLIAQKSQSGDDATPEQAFAFSNKPVTSKSAQTHARSAQPAGSFLDLIA